MVNPKFVLPNKLIICLLISCVLVFVILRVASMIYLTPLNFDSLLIYPNYSSATNDSGDDDDGSSSIIETSTPAVPSAILALRKAVKLARSQAAWQKRVADLSIQQSDYQRILNQSPSSPSSSSSSSSLNSGGHHGRIHHYENPATGTHIIIDVNQLLKKYDDHYIRNYVNFDRNRKMNDLETAEMMLNEYFNPVFKFHKALYKNSQRTSMLKSIRDKMDVDRQDVIVIRGGNNNNNNQSLNNQLITANSISTMTTQNSIINTAEPGTTAAATTAATINTMTTKSNNIHPLFTNRPLTFLGFFSSIRKMETYERKK